MNKHSCRCSPTGILIDRSVAQLQIPGEYWRGSSQVLQITEVWQGMG